MNTRLQTIENQPYSQEPEIGRPGLVDTSVRHLAESILRAFGSEEARNFLAAEELARLGVEMAPAQPAPPSPNRLSYLPPNTVQQPARTPNADYGIAG